MTPDRPLRHLLGIAGLSAGQIAGLIETAGYFHQVLDRPIKKVPSLRQVTVANIFYEDSTRTRLSFELAEKRLSADVVNFGQSGSSVKKGETLLDTVRNILAMRVDMVVLRHPAPGAPHFLARSLAKAGGAAANVSIVNAGDGAHEHPTQALLDALTIHRRLGRLEGVRVAIVGDVLHSRVARSNFLLLKKMGAQVRAYGPPALLPYYRDAFGIDGWGHRVEEALDWAEVLIVLRLQLERMNQRYIASLDEYRRHYGITLPRLAGAKGGGPSILMHPGPINRGVELTAEAADDPTRSVILDQVESGVAMRMAVLYTLAGIPDGPLA